MLIIPLAATPNQAVRVQLNGQNSQINVYQKDQGLFLDLLVDNAPMVMGVICQRANRIVRDAYLGFSGDLVWGDIQGTDDPDYAGIGTRYLLAYLFPSELATAG